MRDYPLGRDRFVPASILDRRTSCGGLRRSVKAVLDLVDTGDPAWPAVAVVLQEFTAAGVDLDETSVVMAVKIGKQRWAGEGPAEASESLTLPTAPDSIVYYIRRADMIKIGTTTQPHDRFSNLLPDEILAFEPGGRKEETLRHRQFRHLRAGGEYFRDGPELRDHIHRIRSSHGDPDPTWPTSETLWSARIPWRLTKPASTETMTAAEAVTELGIKEMTLRSWVHRGRLQHVGCDERRRYTYYREHLIQLRDSRYRRVPGIF